MAAGHFQHEGRGRVLRISPSIPPPLMTRTAASALSLGVLLFIGLLAWQGLPAVIDSLALAGWGLLLVALFHLLPLALDAAAIRVLFVAGGTAQGSMRDARPNRPIA